MKLATDVRKAFAAHPIGHPCTNEQIELAERELGHPLPSSIRDLYREMNGFVGPTGAQFLYPLLDQVKGSSQPSLVGHTLFLRSEEYFPAFLSKAIVVGDDGTGPARLVFLDQPQRVALWDAEWGDEIEWLGGSLLDVWLQAKDMYDVIRKDT
jgi:hypothetical protein